MSEPKPKKTMTGFQATEAERAWIDRRSAELGLSKSDYLKGLVRKDQEGPPPTPPFPSFELAIPAAPSPTATTQKRLGWDLALLLAWLLSALPFVQAFGEEGVDAVARKYVTTDRMLVRHRLLALWRVSLRASWAAVTAFGFLFKEDRGK